MTNTKAVPPVGWLGEVGKCRNGHYPDAERTAVLPENDAEPAGLQTRS